MNHGRSVVLAGILVLSATLAACGGGSSGADVDAAATTPDTSPVVSNRGANLHDASSNTTAASGLATAAAILTPKSPAATTTQSATQTVRTIAPAATTQAQQPQSLTLTWTAPDDNSDGSPLVDLSGYKIRFGTSSGHYTQTVTLSNAGLNRYVVDSLPAGTYYFTISAYNSAGTESPLTGEVSTTI